MKKDHWYHWPYHGFWCLDSLESPIHPWCCQTIWDKQALAFLGELFQPLFPFLCWEIIKNVFLSFLKLIQHGEGLSCTKVSVTGVRVIWRHRSGSTLAQVMTCCLTAPSHYLNQCWLLIRQVLFHSHERIFIASTHATPDNKVHVAHMGPSWGLSALGGAHVGPMNLAIRDYIVWWVWKLDFYCQISQGPMS